MRWLRSDSENQAAQIGLQMVSRRAIPVRVGFRGAPEQGTTGALVLPAPPALRQHQVIMAPAGTYVFALPRWRRTSTASDVAQCRLLTLISRRQPSKLFQFEVDPYPI